MDLEKLLIDLITNGGLHGALTVAVIVLWRENRRLVGKLEELRQTSASTHAIVLKQADSIQEVIDGYWVSEEKRKNEES
jgi:hypothetical protein